MSSLMTRHLTRVARFKKTHLKNLIGGWQIEHFEDLSFRLWQLDITLQRRLRLELGRRRLRVGVGDVDFDVDITELCRLFGRFRLNFGALKKINYF